MGTARQRLPRRGFDLAALHPTDLRHRLPWGQPGQAARLAQIRSALAEMAASRGTTMANVAIGWTCRRAGRHAISGARTPGEALALAAVRPLDAESAARLDALG